MSEILSRIAVNKSLLKEYESENGRTVYLKDDEEFQIQLFNPYDYVIGADVYINNNSLGNTIIIRPGQRIWLERYLDSPNKFKFSVYTVDGSYEAKQAIKNNGTISIKFYSERKRYVYHNDVVSIKTLKNWDDGITWSTSDPYSFDNITCTCAIADADVSTYSTACYCSSDLSASSVGKSSWASTSTSRCLTNSEIETGRVEKGSHSNQSFNTVNADLNSWPFKTENIKLLPISQKPYTDKDLNKLYCPECGRRMKSKFKFCPFCGNEL